MQRGGSFDDLVGGDQQGLGNGKAQRLCCFSVDEKLDGGGLFHGQVARFGALEYLVDVGGRATVRLREVLAVTHERARDDMVPVDADRRHAGFECCRGEWRAERGKQCVSGDKHRTGPERCALAKALSTSLVVPTSDARIPIFMPLAAACTLFSSAAWPEFPGFRMTTTFDSFGTIAASISRCFWLRSMAMAERPVTLPPGWARLAARPLPTGSMAAAITIGIEEVTAQCLRRRGSVSDQQIRFCEHEFRCKRRELVVPAVSKPPFHREVFALDVAQFAHAVKKCLDERVRSARGGLHAGAEKTDSPDFAGLLGTRADGYRHHCKKRTNCIASIQLVPLDLKQLSSKASVSGGHLNRQLAPANRHDLRITGCRTVQ